jgi:hypothetical protein
VSLCIASRRRLAARPWIRASRYRARYRARYLRPDPGSRRASSRLTRRSARNEPSKARGFGMGGTSVDSTARWRMPTSTPTTVVLPLLADTARSTSTVKATYQRSAVRLIAAARMEAAGVPGATLLLEPREADRSRPGLRWPGYGEWGGGVQARRAPRRVWPWMVLVDVVAFVGWSWRQMIASRRCWSSTRRVCSRSIRPLRMGRLRSGWPALPQDNGLIRITPISR